MLFRVRTGGDRKSDCSFQEADIHWQPDDDKTADVATSGGRRRCCFELDEDDRNDFAFMSRTQRSHSPTSTTDDVAGSSSPPAKLEVEKKSLPPSSYTEFDLVNHVQHITRDQKETVTALGEVFTRRNSLTALTWFTVDSDVMVDTDEESACEIFEAQLDGSVIQLSEEQAATDDDDATLYSAGIWEKIKVSLCEAGLRSDAHCLTSNFLLRM